MAIYADPETGQTISTHSMLKTFRRCPKQAEYKYLQRLKPKRPSKPLKQGSWMHSLQQAKYEGKDWRVVHRHLTHQFSKLFDEEKEALGDLPRECARLMIAYEYYYEHEDWEVLEVEHVIETELPDGAIYRGKVDLIIENEFGIWIVDHKWNRSLPDLNFRIIDAQSALYLWAARRSGIPAEGFIWNYGRRKAPTIPKLLKDGSRLSQRYIETEYTTFVRALKKYELDLKPYRRQIRALRNQQYRHGELQTSPFFRRDILEKDNAMLRRVAQEAFHTHKRMNSYPWEKPQLVERVPDRSCGFMCSYEDICTLELFGGDPRSIRRQRYEEADPMEYYQDDPKMGVEEARDGG